MNPLILVRAVATICTGLAAGIFLGHRRGVSLAVPALPASSFVQLQQIIHTHFARMMPPLMLVAVATSFAWVIQIRTAWHTTAFWLVAGAALAMVAVLAMTRAVNIPINRELMTWNIEAPPADFRQQWAPWERIHSTRTGLAILALVAQVLALSGPT